MDGVGRAHAIKNRETVGGLQMTKSLFDGALILHETVEHIARKADIHPALPIDERHILGEVALNEFLGRDIEIKYCIRFEGDAENVFQPRFVHAPNHVASHQRVDIPLLEHNKSRLQSSYNALS